MVDSGEQRERHKLTDYERSQIRDDTNIDALERLLEALPAEPRAYVHRLFIRASVDSPDVSLTSLAPAQRRATLPTMPEDLTFSDPALQALLEQAIAPSRARSAGLISGVLERRLRSEELRAWPIGIAVLQVVETASPRVLVSRRASLEPSDIVVLCPNYATPEHLDAAIQQLLTERREVGLRIGCDAEIVLPIEERAAVLPSSWRRELQRALDAVSRRPLRDVQGFGDCRFIMFPLDVNAEL